MKALTIEACLCSIIEIFTPDAMITNQLILWCGYPTEEHWGHSLLAVGE